MLIGVFDIGGTFIKYGIATQNGELLYNNDAPTEAMLGGHSVMKKILSISDVMIDKWGIEGISISSAGQINSLSGCVVHATDNIPKYTGTPVAGLVKEYTKLEVKVENDVNCTALGEHWKGAAMGIDNFICLTLGTGIGGSLFLNGHLYSGANFAAGEFGHITLYPNGKDCTCGNRGCLEQYASSSALEKTIVEKFGYPIDLIQFFEMVKRGDLEGTEIYTRWLDDLTTGLQSIVHSFNPQLIVIGGGVTGQGDFLLESIKKSIAEKLMPNHRNTLEIKFARHGNAANLLGAARHYFM
jgi:predicted NBD/HSP70 family sugar kinase